MKKQVILFLFSIQVLMSCGQTNKLSEEDYSWMQYKGNETLIFKSNTGNTDTIFLLKKDTLLAYPEAQSMKGTKYETVSVFCKHSDPSLQIDDHRYLEGYFLKIGKAKDKQAEINILLSAKDAKFYRLSRIRIDSLRSVSPVSLQTSSMLYDDVYIINAEDYLGSLSERNNYVTKIYWSKSKGIIRYDKRNNVYWELL